jgi:hypothetical protein
VTTADGSKHYDPLLKLYFKRPVMINENINVENCEANGTMCEFEGVVFKQGITYESLEIIQIDGFYVWCAHVTQIEALKLRLLDGVDKAKGEVKYSYLKPEKMTGRAFMPTSVLDPIIDHKTPRKWRGMKMEQFPINCANARTIHKLQGRSIENIVISNWDYQSNWVYVALSRVKKMKGLFLRQPLRQSKCRGMSLEVRDFMDKLRSKPPPPRVEIRR